jgi:hypothetical protein
VAINVEVNIWDVVCDTATTGGEVAGEVLNQTVIRIVTGGQVATYEVLDGNAFSLSADLAATILKSFSAIVADLSTIYLKDIKRIFDDQGDEDNNERLFVQITEPKIFTLLHKDPFFRQRIAWMQRGDTLLFFVGPDADPLGNITMDFRGKPALYTNSTENNVLDIPPEMNQLLMDGMLLEYAAYGKGAPVDVNGAIKARYDSAMADLQKKLDDKGKRD